MSRIGKKPSRPEGRHRQGRAPDAVEVQGPKGKLRQPFPAGIAFALEGDAQAKTLRRIRQLGKFHGLARSLIANAVHGVTEGFKQGARHRRRRLPRGAQGQAGDFALGYSHPVVFDIPPGIDIAVDKQTHITVTGVDRQLVGQVAANIRRLRKPDPVQAEGRPLHRRSAEEEGRQDGSEVARLSFPLPAEVESSGGAERAPGARHEDQHEEGSTRPDRLRQRKRIAGTTERPRLRVFRSVVAHLRAGDRRHDRHDDRVGGQHGAGAEGRARRTARGGNRLAQRCSARRSPSGSTRRGSSASCSTAAGSSITAGFEPLPRPRAKAGLEF